MDYKDFKSCLNCEHSYTWHESYVSASGKCPWLVKKVEEKEKT